MAMIHPTAFVHPDAKLHSTVSVGAFSVIGPQVQIGAETQIQAYVAIEGDTEIGERNQIFNSAQIGQIPIDRSYGGEHTKLVLGHDNVIREFCTIHPGTLKQDGITRIGHANLFMCYVHVAHDCLIGDHNIVANGTQLAGHVRIDHHVVVGGLVGIHQFCRIGSYSMVGAGSMVSNDVLPYCLVAGDRATLKGLNLIGLRRKGFSSQEVAALKQAYQSFVKREAFPSTGSLHVKFFSDFVSESQRGVIRPKKKGSFAQDFF